MGSRWITFDCYGTLVDWKTGFSEILGPIAGKRTPELLSAYHPHEPRVQAERPFHPYKQVLTIALSRAASEIGIDITEEQTRSLPQQWSKLPVFGDVEEALAQLRAAGCKLGVLTNCDDDLFAQTQRSFQFRFDRVVTAEQVRDYKPSRGHFLFFERATKVQRNEWVHVASSWFHDIAPAREIGINCIWLDRDNTREDPATVRVASASALPAAIRNFYAKST